MFGCAIVAVDSWKNLISREIRPEFDPITAWNQFQTAHITRRLCTIEKSISVARLWFVSLQRGLADN
jgi:hypothetical protein